MPYDPVVTPVGHAAVGYACGRAVKRWPAWAWVLGAMLPDVDYLFAWHPSFNALHRVVTHNFLFAAAAAGVAYVITRSRGAALALLLGMATHFVVDSMLDTNPSNGIGVAIAWPLTDAVVSPVNLVSARNPAGWHDPWAQAGTMAVPLLWEVPFWLLAAVLVLHSRNRRKGLAARARSGTSDPGGLH